jgi:hypothetical protein
MMKKHGSNDDKSVYKGRLRVELVDIEVVVCRYVYEDSRSVQIPDNILEI